MSHFKFIDLFAGIGGFHLAMHRLGGECVFAAEIDRFARQTYEHNFKAICPNLFENGNFVADIRQVMPEDIPDFDILCAGFPCQPFSQAGYKRGFADNHKSERGNLFFNIAEIIEAKRPKAFFLENVRGLVNHDKGKTFKIIHDILEKELGYSFYYKVVKASDYGLPQLRPRVFIVGFRDESFLRGFTFPPKIPLKFTMSDVWQGNCSRDIGFTIRVGGRGSKIDDRRNWDAYMVDGNVKQLGSHEAKKMQGFPDTFLFPVSETQAMKQLGNSVAVDAVKAIGENLVRHMDRLFDNQNSKKTPMKPTNNKGEWTELLVFLKTLHDRQIFLADADLDKTVNYFDIEQVTTRNLNLTFLLNRKNVAILDESNKKTKTINISKIINQQVLDRLTQKIKEGKGTFEIEEFKIIQNELGLEVVKGGTSKQKPDIVLDIDYKGIKKKNEGFGIKSYLGSKPTLLNASGNTNFIFEVKALKADDIDIINNIQGRQKLIKRIGKIQDLGGTLEYAGAEKSTMEYNLKYIDLLMPQLIGYILTTFYQHRISSINENVDFIDQHTDAREKLKYDDKAVLTSKVQDLLVAVLLGFFAGTKWDGNYISNGTIVMKKTGDYVAFHIVDLKNLKSYLFNHIKLDTPSTTRHRFGTLYLEKDGKMYFKLNLQMRFK